MASPISQAIKQICDEKNIPMESVQETIESALAAAYRKDFGNKNQNIKVEFDPEKYDGATAGIRVFDVKAVVEDMELPDDYFKKFDESSIAKRQEMIRPFPVRPVATPADGSAAVSEEDQFKFNPKTMIMLRDARDIKPDAAVGEEIRVELSIPAAFGRMAAQTAKQVIMQKLREAERGVIFSDFKGREGELMNVTVQRREGRIVLIDLGRATGILLPEDQIEMERYYPGTRLKALLREVVMTPKGPEIRLSRSSSELVAALFAQEIPEVANGIVQLKAIAREAGSRTKVAVTTNDDAIDPIGSCIGQRGTRIQSVIRELGGEKVDVVLWSEDVSEYIANALSPAKVTNVELRQADHLASVTVLGDQLSLAIGKGGQNVRLAAKLTNWKITIVEEGGKALADSDVGEIVQAALESKLDENGEKAETADQADLKASE
ncbi:transcription termination factor NusA [Candidatus Uhrbacteria bacterium RIFCSPHIGHO2_12_FULL_60_25]|uniref:Transcription termination/antitermination protein NusA n=1 Tax=Candidatus Uhrbacteria bacterium RIFCSPHIGHO2_12_FULL_60_25 TaxID=1802399 RepID=A0A1F7UMX1_9BACT|nr:MAG: transcription termination factor NusA [Candidatus Uhrbacteria bacterium RIFCSPHIGHO2_02_FULL_60_44]OGL79612.1 MAG: transcription termination factor NusA [Candidatus Uhrbacteria bacterium RIFCSPHIGHO2_12_FULL_60_25]